MTAKEQKEQAFYPTGSDGDGNVFGDYHFTLPQMQAFTDQLCKEQREICAKTYLSNIEFTTTGNFKAITEALKPEL